MGLSQSFGKKREKPQETSQNKPSRVRLTWINGVPKVQDARLLLAEAQKNRGIPCELPIRAVLGAFVLSCQADHLSSEPCWTLFEGDDGNKQVWSYMNDNPDMIADIVSMSVTNKDARTEVNMPRAETLDSLAPAPSSYADSRPPAPSSQPAQPLAHDYAQAPTMPDTNQPFDPYAGWSAPQPQAPPEQPIQQLQPPDGGWGAQPAPTSGWAQPGAGPPDSSWPSQPHAPQPQNPPPGWGAGEPQPQNQPPGWGAAAPQPQNPPPGWGAGAPQPQNPPPGWGASPPQSDSPWLQGGSVNGNGNINNPEKIAHFVKSLENRPDVTIGELSMDPLLPSACVDAALKLQEMVLKGHFPDNVAVQALKLSALNNGVLDDGVILRAKAEASADPNEVARQAAGILQHAGLLTEADITRAANNLVKHNNSFAEALISSGKIDKLILEAAQDCQPLLAESRMRQDQAIIALHYCHRSRVKLKDAIEELSIDLL